MRWPTLAGQDPFDLRLAHLQGEEEKVRRAREVLLRLESDWDSPKAEGIGRGLAIMENRRTIAATVIEAKAKVEDGQIRVTKATSAIDPGTIVNPEGVRMQVESCVMMGISASLYEETAVPSQKIASQPSLGLCN